jgi:hypothetical protein
MTARKKSPFEGLGESMMAILESGGPEPAQDPGCAVYREQAGTDKCLYWRCDRCRPEATHSKAEICAFLEQWPTVWRVVEDLRVEVAELRRILREAS